MTALARSYSGDDVTAVFDALAGVKLTFTTGNALDKETGDLYMRAQRNLGDRFARGFRIKVRDTIAGSVMRTGGTQSMSGDDIDAKLEAIGASVETSIGTASGSASSNGLSEYAETIVSVLADVMRHPVFDEDKIYLARTEARAMISRRNDDPMQINVREFRKLIYDRPVPPPEGYMDKPVNEEELVSNIKRILDLREKKS